MRIRGINPSQALLALALLAALCWNLAYGAELRGVELRSGPTGTHAELRLDARAEYKVIPLANPDRLVVDLPGTRLRGNLALPGGQGIVKNVRSGQPVPGTTRIVFDLANPTVALAPRLEEGPDGVRLVLQWPGDGEADPIARVAAGGSAAPAPAPGPVTTVATALPPRVPSPPAVDPSAASNDATSRLIAGMPRADVGSQSPPSAVAAATTSAPEAVAPATPAPMAGGAAPVVEAAPPPAPSAPPAARPRTPVMTSSMRPLVIAIDPGHGGQDPGAIGPGGTYEKHVVLSIARELARQINATPGMRAHLIRDNDAYIELTQRARRARQAKADMFVSIHADAALNRAAYGSSVYTLSTRGASSQQARWLADRENNADLVGGVRLERDTLSSVLLDLAQSGHMKASQDAAQHVLTGLRAVGKTHKPNVEYANFAVLRNADMPAMLVETGFISNPDEEKRLVDPGHQRRIASAVLDGITAFFSNQPPPGTLFAARAAAAEQAGGSP
ncbi:N-acetylmuramoyl-L-alanine amidase [Luteimonas deserti]|uniref:N-acetylmuramoyl-L-alanine amidase AmiC n=1 Tax=Luteimonas deserti TaxID=2752306 RepID=A0A7Z0QUS0_9GAMM|nr:N-acetylmuramoyl-L-alanine amidase [Luteimonas deserti]NYZ63813.1 N-acetylmuramoyl-L-alanine amidase [Luteimonas deserti]